MQPSVLPRLHPAVGHTEIQLPALQDGHEDHQGLRVGRPTSHRVRCLPTRSASPCRIPPRQHHPPQRHCGTRSILCATAAQGCRARDEGNCGRPPAAAVGSSIQGATPHPRPRAARPAPEALRHPRVPVVAGQVYREPVPMLPVSAGAGQGCHGAVHRAQRGSQRRAHHPLAH